MSHAYGKLKTPDKSTLFLQDKNILSSHTNFRNLHKAIVYRDAVIHPFYFHHIWSFMACCIILLYNVCSVHQGGGECLLHCGVFSTLGRYHEYIRGYPACIGECLVRQGKTMSTSEDIMSTLGDCPVHQRDIMIHVGSKVTKPFSLYWKPWCTEHPPMYSWYLPMY